MNTIIIELFNHILIKNFLLILFNIIKWNYNILAKEEEREALRYQKEKLEQLDEDDFLDDSFAAKLAGAAADENEVI